MTQLLKTEKSIVTFCILYMCWLMGFRYLFRNTQDLSILMTSFLSLISYLPIIVLALTCYRKEVKQWLNLQIRWPLVAGLIVYIAVSIFNYFLSTTLIGRIDSGLFIFTVIDYLLMTGVWEEIMFRGIVYTTFKNKRGIAFAILASVLLFTLAHVQVIFSGQPEYIFSFIIASIFISITFICLYERTHSLWLSIFCHALWDINNTIAFPLFIYLDAVLIIEQVIKYKKQQKVVKETKISS